MLSTLLLWTLLAAGTPAPPPAPSATSATDAAAAVEQYYRWYVDQMEKGADPLGDHVYRKDPRIAPELAAWFDAFLKHDREYDPILQAQDDPNRVTVDRSKVQVMGDKAVVPVQLWYDDTTPHVVQVHVVRIGGVWKLRKIEEAE